VTLLSEMPAAFSLNSLKAYSEESDIDVAAEHLSPSLLTLVCPKLDPNKSTSDALEGALLKIPNSTKF
jgi:hypothetical protein